MKHLGFIRVAIRASTWNQNLKDNEIRTWTDASSKCQLLGSNERGVFSELPEVYRDRVPQDGREYWIAAIKKTTAPFKFSRCIAITNDIKERKTYLHNTTQPVYDCYNFCNGSRFALSSMQCVCINLGQESQIKCNTKLYENTQMDFFSVGGFLEYQTHQSSYLQANGTGDCAAVILGPGQDVGRMHYFLPCSTKLPSVCMSDGIKVVLHTESRNWIESVLACDGFLRGSFDGIYPLSNPPSNFAMAWTGISRRSILQWSTGNETAPFECLAVSKEKKSDVYIQPKNCSDLLPSLCEQEEITTQSMGLETITQSKELETITQSMGLETITQSMGLEKITQSKELITYSGTPPEESTKQEIRSFADYNQCHPDDNGVTILAIGITLIIISGLFFLVSSVIVWKARNMKKSAKNTMIRSTYDSVNINAAVSSNYSQLEFSTTTTPHSSTNQENDEYMVPFSYK